MIYDSHKDMLHALNSFTRVLRRPSETDLLHLKPCNLVSWQHRWTHTHQRNRCATGDRERHGHSQRTEVIVIVSKLAAALLKGH
jgi:hypothetical protein